MKPLDANYDQMLLLPRSLEDLVGPEHPARYVREFVEALRQGGIDLADEKDPLGRPGYSVWLLVKIWLLAYAMRLRSSREVEQACRDHLGMMWICGGLRPDHNTLWRFWKAQQSLIKRLFRESVRIAFELGMVDFALHAIDGTKIQAGSSTYRAARRSDLARLLERLDAQLQALETAIGAAGAEGGESLGELNEQLQNRRQLREKIAKAFESAPQDNTARHPGEPEARLMKGCGLGYNAQTVVDAKKEIIVATNVVSDQNDVAQLIPMLDLVHQQWGRVADETVADGGYNTAAALAESDEKQYPVIVAQSAAEAKSNDDPYDAARFHYDYDRDVVICPERQELTFRCTTRRGLRRYRTRACGKCPVRELCTQDKHGRTVDLSPTHLAAVEKQRRKRGDPTKAALLRRRLPVAERPFATIKHRLRLRRFKARSRAGAEAEWFFVCLLYNLTRIFSGSTRVVLA